MGYWEGGVYHDLGGGGHSETVEGDRVTVQGNPQPYFIKLRPGTTPRSFDAEWREGLGGRPFVVHRYAYRLEGDAWLVARLTDPRAGLPASLDGTDPRHYVSLFKRKRP